MVQSEKWHAYYSLVQSIVLYYIHRRDTLQPITLTLISVSNTVPRQFNLMIDTLARLLNAIPSPHYKWVMYYLPDVVVERAYNLQLAKYKQLFITK